MRPVCGRTASRPERRRTALSTASEFRATEQVFARWPASSAEPVFRGALAGPGPPHHDLDRLMGLAEFAAQCRGDCSRVDDPNATPTASLTNIFSEPALLVCQHSYGWGAQGAGDGRGEHGHRADHGGQSTLALEKVERQPGLRPLHCDEPARL